MIDISFTKRPGYTSNQLGYRSIEINDIDWNNTYVIQGCSAVYGLGIKDDDQTIAAALSRKLNCPVVNLGIPGAGVQLQYMNAVEMLSNNQRPKGVFIVWPNIHRFPLMRNGTIENIGSWTADKKYTQWMMEDNSKHQNITHVKAYKLLWKLANVPLHEITHHEENKEFCNAVITKFLDWGDDEQHWGPVTAEHIAEILYQKHLSNHQ